MQTAYVIHMSEGPSIRRIISTKKTDDPDEKRVELTVTVEECDEYFNPKPGMSKTFSSKAARTSWKKNMFSSEPSEAEAIFHFNMRRQLRNQYDYRFEINATLSDPLK